MTLFELIQMLGQGNEDFEAAGYDKYDYPPFSHKNVKVSLNGRSFHLKDLCMSVTEQDIILEADDGPPQT